MAGIAWWRDRGVADHNDIITVGDQYDFNRKSDWLDDDSPGWGASYDDMAGKIIADNPAAVADYKAGKEQSLKFLVGQMMRLSKGRANPAVASDIILRKLKDLS